MTLALLTLGVLLTAGPVKVAAPGFSQHGLEQTAADFYSDQVAQQLSFHGLKVITRSEVSAILGHERQRQLLGCNDDSGSCAVELAGALGTDALLLGEVAKVGDSYRLSVRVLSSKDGDKLSSAVVSGTSEDAVLGAFGQVAARLADEVRSAIKGEPRTQSGVISQRTGARRFFWIPAAMGAVALGGGAFAYTQSRARYEELRSSPSLVEPRPSQLRSEGQNLQLMAAIGAGVAAAGLATAACLYAFGSDATVEAGVVLAPGGGSAVVSGVFP